MGLLSRIGFKPETNEEKVQRLLAKAESTLPKHAKTALKLCNEVLAIEPKNADAIKNRGIALFIERDYKTAIADLTAAFTLNPRNLDLLSKRAKSYLETNQFDKAIADYKVLLEKNPKSSTALELRASCYEKLGEHVKAAEDYSVLLDMSPERIFLMDRARCYMAAGHYQAAITDLTEKLLWYPLNSDERATLYIYPKDGKALYMRSQAYLALGDQLKAQGKQKEADQNYLLAYESAYQSESFYSKYAKEKHEKIVHTWTPMVKALMGLQRYQAAIDFIADNTPSKSEHFESYHIDLICFKAECYKMIGKIDLARVEYGKVLAASEVFPEAKKAQQYLADLK